MTVDQIRALHRAQPFCAFDIHLADGRSLAIEHPEMLAITGRTIGVGLPNETIEIVDLLLVTSLKPREGKSRGKRSR
jgi:hypothetical protein